MKHICLSSAAALAAAVLMSGCGTYAGFGNSADLQSSPSDSMYPDYGYSDNIYYPAYYRTPPVAYSEPTWYYDARTGYYYSRPYYDAPPRYYHEPRAYYEEPRAYPSASAGVVERIELVRRGDGSAVAGTIIGGIVGGVIGHQIGSGSGNTAATIAGAAGGAVAGHEVGRRARNDEAFRVTVRLDNGAFHTVMLDRVVELRTGDRVRLEGNTLYRG